MSFISIHGGIPLCGEVSIHGSKNAILPILAASLLVTKGRTKLTFCPNISDVDCSISLLHSLGCEVIVTGDNIVIDATGATYHELRQDIVGSMRGSVLMLGALLGRFHKAVISSPGGCTIGERKIDYHIDVLKSLGVIFSNDASALNASVDKLVGTEFVFEGSSVGATENALIASVLAEGRTILKNTAREPEIYSLIEFLNGAGAKITEIEDGVIEIIGVKSLSGSEYHLPPDRIVAGTYMVAVAATGGHAIIKNVREADQRSLITVLRSCGCKIAMYKDNCIIIGKKRLKAVNLVTEPYPGFPTDMQSQMLAALTIADGISVIEERIFEDRFKTIAELEKMGAVFLEKSKKRSKVAGVAKLHGANVIASDLRGGAALCIAGLMADGHTKISGGSYIERGYENICEDLRKLGADIALVPESETLYLSTHRIPPNVILADS